MIETISIVHYLITSSILFSIGTAGLLMNRKSLVQVLISVELMLLSVNINLVAFSVYRQDATGQIFSLLILAIAAAETALGLAIILNYFRAKSSLQLSQIKDLRG
jgi:NADH-quinone oxidoreductase subunit K